MTFLIFPSILVYLLINFTTSTDQSLPCNGENLGYLQLGPYMVSQNMDDQK